MRIPAAFAAITLVLCCDLAAQAPRDTATLNQWKPIETVTSKGPEGLENPDTLVLRNGRRISAELHNTRFLGFIPSRGGPPYLVLAGRGCGECDAIEAVYIQSPSGRGPRPPGLVYYGPGVWLSENGTDTTQHTRVFLGHCLPKMTVGVVWFVNIRGQTDVNDRKVRIIDLSADTLRVRDLPKPRPTDDAVLPFVQSSACQELQ